MHKIDLVFYLFWWSVGMLHAISGVVHEERGKWSWDRFIAVGIILVSIIGVVRCIYG